MLGIPIKLSDTPGAVEIAPPRFGEHNREVLLRLGYAEAEVAQFAELGVIADMG